MVRRVAWTGVALLAGTLSVASLRSQAPLQGGQLTKLNSLIAKLEKNGWDSDGNGVGDKGIVEILFVEPDHPLRAELVAELAAAGLAMNDKTKKCVMGALEGLKKAAEGDPDGEDGDGKKKRKSRVVIADELDGYLDADCSPNEVAVKDGKTSQKHTAEKCTDRQRIRISSKGAGALDHALGFMGPVLMHEGKRACQVFSVANAASLTAAEVAAQKKLDCEAAETQMLIWIAWKMVAKDRSQPPPEPQPKAYQFACKAIKDAKKAKEKLQ